MEPLFLLDGMLGSLARWLRICGYDTVYRRDADDEELMEEALSRKRILVTGDRMLAKRAQKRDVEACYIQGKSVTERLRVLGVRYNLKLEPTESRCPKCNGELVKVEKEEINNQVPKCSQEAYNNFWRCNSCGSVFWRGSHWENISRTLEAASCTDSL
ncbi:MAG: Mut7-C RNAse domain-containing protein [Candidatus Bathyarchaeia archaeon]